MLHFIQLHVYISNQIHMLHIYFNATIKQMLKHKEKSKMKKHMASRVRAVLPPPGRLVTNIMKGREKNKPKAIWTNALLI